MSLTVMATGWATTLVWFPYATKKIVDSLKQTTKGKKRENNAYQAFDAMPSHPIFGH